MANGEINKTTISIRMSTRKRLTAESKRQRRTISDTLETMLALIQAKREAGEPVGDPIGWHTDADDDEDEDDEAPRERKTNAERQREYRERKRQREGLPPPRPRGRPRMTDAEKAEAAARRAAEKERASIPAPPHISPNAHRLAQTAADGWLSSVNNGDGSMPAA